MFLELQEYKMVINIPCQHTCTSTPPVFLLLNPLSPNNDQHLISPIFTGIFRVIIRKELCHVPVPTLFGRVDLYVRSNARSSDRI